MSCVNAISIFNTLLKGTVTFHQCSDQHTTITVNLIGFEPNKLIGFHIHEFGDTQNGCESMGSHYNPFHKNHGCYLFDGKDRHVGDLINNVYSDNLGRVKISFIDDMVNLSGKYNVIGRGLVFHEKYDDLGQYGPFPTSGNLESLKTGNAGKRISCAPIVFCKGNI